MAELFKIRDIKYSLRNNNIMISKNIKTVHYGKESISYIAPIIWKQVPHEIKCSKSIISFKNKIKHWKPKKL